MILYHVPVHTLHICIMETAKNEIYQKCATTALKEPDKETSNNFLLSSARRGLKSSERVENCQKALSLSQHYTEDEVFLCLATFIR